MLLQQLFQNLDDIIRIPEDVTYLNKAIVGLAIRGRLATQDPHDAPVTVFVAQKRQNLLSLQELDDIPKSWAWVQLDDLSPQYQNGCSRRNPAEKGLTVPVLRLADITSSEIDLSSVRSLTLLPQEATKYSLLKDDILVTRVNGSSDLVGSFTLLRTNLAACYCDHFIRVRFDQRLVLSEYLVMAGKSRWVRDQVARKFITTAGQKTVNQTHIGGLWFPLPPLAEQHRIVAKVDELLAQTRALEANLRRAQEEIVVVNRAALHRLEIAEDPASLHAAWHTIAGAFDLLYDDQRPLAALRQTILQLAVRGKLVRQDERDEPAQLLLEQIRQYRSQLDLALYHPNSELRRQVKREDEPFKIPTTWKWVTFSEIGELARGQSKHRPRNDPSLYKDGIYPFIQTGDVSRARDWINTYSASYNEFGLAQSRLWPRGTLCITIAANIGETGILSMDACFPDSVVGWLPYAPLTSARFFQLFMEVAKHRLADSASATAQKNINLGVLANLLLPLPPLLEIERITAQVDMLMQLCDDYERHWQVANETRRAAMEAVLAYVAQEA